MESSSTEVHISGNVVVGEARFPWRNFFLFLLLFLVSTHWLSRVYANLCIAFVIAFLLEPTVRWLDRKKVPRYLGSLLVMIAFTSLISLVVVLITPKIFSQMNELMVRLPYFFQTFMESVSAKSMQILGYNVFADFERTMQTLSTNSELMKPFGGVVQKVFLSSYQFFSSCSGFWLFRYLLITCLGISICRASSSTVRFQISIMKPCMKFASG